MNKYKELKKKYNIGNKNITDVFYVIVNKETQEKEVQNYYGVPSNFSNYYSKGQAIEILVIDNESRWYNWKEGSDTYFRIFVSAIEKIVTEENDPEYFI